MAHGYLPGRQPLAAGDFSGGEAVIRKLTKLGFQMTDHTDLPLPGSALTNAEIANHFSVGIMGGMRRNIRTNVLVLISDPFKGLYQDRWEGDTLHYTGTGTVGDQSLSHSQNRTLSESMKAVLAIHLLEFRERLKYTYLGQVELFEDPYQEDQPDEQDQIRKAWMFPIRLKQPELVPAPTLEQIYLIEESQARLVSKLSLDVLRSNATRAPRRAASKTTQSSTFVRNGSVAEYVKRIANGYCDLCTAPAPFRNKQKEHYLESHHVIWLARDGNDSIENTVALCPNCHRRMHILDSAKDRQKLTELAKRRWAEESATAPNSCSSTNSASRIPRRHKGLRFGWIARTENVRMASEDPLGLRQPVTPLVLLATAVYEGFRHSALGRAANWSPVMR